MFRVFLAATLLGLLAGCSVMSTSKSPSQSTATTAGTTAGTPAASQPAAAASDKAAKKISMAIGREVADFTITNTEESDAPTGYNGTRYTVKTKDGSTYKCDILEPSGLGKIATWGMASGADAMCTDFTKGSPSAGKTNEASCNALLRAAGKC
jgi:hypothetical protein